MQSPARARGLRHIDLTDVQLASSETARHINRDIVLELIRANQPISRADLSRQSGLQRSTVSQIVEQLIHEKWVTEGGTASPPEIRLPATWPEDRREQAPEASAARPRENHSPDD